MWDKLPTSLQCLKLTDVLLPGQPCSYIVEQIMNANHARLPNLTKVEIRIRLLPLPPKPQPEDSVLGRLIKSYGDRGLKLVIR